MPSRLLLRDIQHEMFGMGPLEPLMADPAVSDILVNGSRQVYVGRHGRLERTAVRFRDDAHLMKIIDKIVSRVGRRVDEFSPMVDARMADGSRVNVVIPPLAIDGPCLSIRRFAVMPLTMDDLCRSASLTPDIAPCWPARLVSRSIRAAPTWCARLSAAVDAASLAAARGVARRGCRLPQRRRAPCRRPRLPRQLP